MCCAPWVCENKRMNCLLCASLLALAVAPAPAQSATPIFGKGPVPFALLRQSWIEDLEAHRLLSSLAHYTPDADFLEPDGQHAEGIAAIRQMYTTVFERFNSHIHFASRVTGTSGDLAYDSGSYVEDLTDRATQARLHLEGDYLTIYHRFGLQWLIVQQAFTEAPPAAPSAK